MEAKPPPTWLLLFSMQIYIKTCPVDCLKDRPEALIPEARGCAATRYPGCPVHKSIPRQRLFPTRESIFIDNRCRGGIFSSFPGVAFCRTQPRATRTKRAALSRLSHFDVARCGPKVGFFRGISGNRLNTRVPTKRVRPGIRPPGPFLTPGKSRSAPGYKTRHPPSRPGQCRS